MVVVDMTEKGERKKKAPRGGRVISAWPAQRSDQHAVLGGRVVRPVAHRAVFLNRAAAGLEVLQEIGTNLLADEEREGSAPAVVLTGLVFVAVQDADQLTGDPALDPLIDDGDGPAHIGGIGLMSAPSG